MTRVLVVEDDGDVNDLICRYLSRRDFQCVGATSATECLARLAASPLPDVILIDLELPDLDGAVLLERIRQRPAARRIPVIVVSGAKVLHRMDGLAHIGADAWLCKPFEPKELLARVCELTGREYVGARPRPAGVDRPAI